MQGLNYNALVCKVGLTNFTVTCYQEDAQECNKTNTIVCFHEFFVFFLNFVPLLENTHTHTRTHTVQSFVISNSSPLNAIL